MDKELFAKRFWERVDRRDHDECWLWLGPCNSNGYGQFNFDKQKIPAHRTALAMRLGRELGPEEFSCHHCDNPLCVNPDHLYAGSPVSNALDMKSRGRANRWRGRRKGTGNPNAKLCEQDVIEILALRRAVTHRELAQRFGVGLSAIGAIMNGTAWVDIERPQS